MKKISNEMIEKFQSTYKVGLVSTIDDEGCPHISLLSSLQASNPQQLVMGQFIEGLSKENMRKRPEIGFLIMTLDKKIWTGTARWTHSRNEGEEFDMYNKKPLFRYNSYFGIHTVHYFDLIEISGGADLNMGAVVFRAVLNLLIRNMLGKPGSQRILKPWAEKLMKGLQTLKFLSWINGEGFPEILPVIEAQAADSATIVIPAKPYACMAVSLKKGSSAAVCGLNLDMVGTLVKGTFNGFRTTPLGKFGTMDIERVYNSLPPKPGYIYPENTAQRASAQPLSASISDS